MDGSGLLTRATRLLIVLTLAVSLCALLEQASEVYAGNRLFVSPAGNDANDCMSPPTACQTIAAAIGKASPGDGIFTADGMYIENLTLDKDLTLIGFGADTTIINGGGTQRVITIPLGITANISGVTVMNGYAGPGLGGGVLVSGTLTLNNTIISGNRASAGGGIANVGALMLINSIISSNWGDTAGGIWNSGTLSLNNSTIISNSTLYGGGGIGSFGTMILNGSAVINNRSYTNGGGIYNYSATVTLNSSVVASNTAKFDLCCSVSGTDDAVWDLLNEPTIGKPEVGQSAEGGGIYNISGTLMLTNTLVSNNTGGNGGGGIVSSRGFMLLTNVAVVRNTVLFGNGGGIALDGLAILTNTTISGNTIRPNGLASFGGGLANYGALTLTNVTISNNSANDGGGIHNGAGYGLTWLKNTIVANNLAGGDCSGSIISLGHNLDSGNTCGLIATGDITNTDPLLGPLQDNGGPTPTHALRPLSPAIGAGDNNGCPPTDQRGVPRPQGAFCDIGAYEAVVTYTNVNSG